ncbi:MAG TPA: hypothetical protein VN775_12815 [Opitutaceae bacterium]|nr:hypothetical protein [Opitutaceae bacterium]
MRRSPEQTYANSLPTPIAVVAGAFRRAWVRVVGRVNGGRAMMENAANRSGDLDGLLVQHAVRHSRLVDDSHRVFRAPGLVDEPRVPSRPARATRTMSMPVAWGSKMGHLFSKPDPS